MILTDEAIRRLVDDSRITIRPFDAARLGPNWYDVSLGHKLAVIDSEEVDPRHPVENVVLDLPPEGLVLEPGLFYLGFVQEVLGSYHVVPLLHATKEAAERGLFVHVTANVIDIGNHANFSLHLVPTRRMRVRPGQVVARASFWRVEGPVTLYKGKYKDARGLAPSKSYLHFSDATGDRDREGP